MCCLVYLTKNALMFDTGIPNMLLLIIVSYIRSAAIAKFM